MLLNCVQQTVFNGGVAGEFMLRSARVSLPLMGLLVGAACGTNTPATQTPPTPTGASYEMSLRLAPGQEAHKCQLVQLPADAAFVIGAQHEYTVGSHHMLLFKTDLTAIPAGLEGVRDCYETGGTSLMSYVRGALYAAQQTTGKVVYPSGVGLPVKAGDVLLFQAHYVNASTSPLDARVQVRLDLGKAESITQRAGVLFFYNPFIHVPESSMARASMRCRLREAITVLGASSHYHKRGVGYAAFLDAPDGALAGTPFYTSTDWEHPRPMQTPLAVPQGARIRFECTYDNMAGARPYYQGQSAEYDEMCMFMGLYFPALDARDELCQAEADMFGVGRTSCLDTARCLQQCGTAAIPNLNGRSQAAVDPCWQRCMAGACPNATRPLINQLTCTRTNCSGQCFVAGPECTACVTRSCTAEALACQTATCAQ